MKVKCSFPDCPHTQEVGILNWLICAALVGDTKWYLCKEHRFSEEEWDNLRDELRRRGKLS